eukprot:CAMPEP_0206611334 /NCGR_PEP_ID=MMETSP0325_2-20121206/55190_1 /ASSEMBLY_ACC=CAM_ASM_000347 /TAXON_ID=2866 /ORGANISM="Crypthecodinium cohnii, Strain Seligo" /LENGTH=146 /DNA_ID=CAMNT_0054130531 /DNA_START=117 /DNA_END=557 /DNA_ORIENTATION=-
MDFASVWTWDYLKHLIEETATVYITLMTDIEIGAGTNSDTDGLLVSADRVLYILPYGERKALIGNGCRRAFNVHGELYLRGFDITNAGLCSDDGESKGGAIYVAEEGHVELSFGLRISNSQRGSSICRRFAHNVFWPEDRGLPGWC